MEFDLVRVGGFVAEAHDLGRLLQDDPAVDPDAFRYAGSGVPMPDRCRVDVLDERYATWAKNLIMAEGAAERDELGEYEERIRELEAKIRLTQLGTIAVFRQAAAKKRRGFTSHSVQSHAPAPRSAPARAEHPRDAVLELAIYPASKYGGQKLGFEVLGSSPVGDLLSTLACRPTKALLTKFALAKFECPPTVAELERLGSDAYNGCSPDTDTNILLHMDGRFYGNSPVPGSKRPCESLDELRWADLEVRLFEPYAFVHHGCCQHFILVRQLRMASPEDAARLGSGFRLVHRSKERMRTCQICEQFSAKYVARNDRLAPENPCYYCGKCFVSLHYSPEGVLAYSDFKLYPYLGE